MATSTDIHRKIILGVISNFLKPFLTKLKYLATIEQVVEVGKQLFLLAIININ